MQQNVIQIICGITINVDVNVKNIYVKMIWNPATCHCENENIEQQKLFQQILMKKNITCKTKSFYILLALFYLLSIFYLVLYY